MRNTMAPDCRRSTLDNFGELQKKKLFPFEFWDNVRGVDLTKLANFKIKMSSVVFEIGNIACLLKAYDI